ncbi:hypothetical protein ABT352_08250 [Streptosporangium sp. NPDC000563]|uniref:hypothetical protein n=1 Tax=Streptosporangium sp. NPDC000563 TaxID=3154366 RepID=UPI00331E3745
MRENENAHAKAGEDVHVRESGDAHVKAGEETRMGESGGDGAPTSLLERRYRHWLRLLPASYRAEREEEMVSVFLEGSPGVSDADGPRPRWSEIASVAVLAVRVRLGGAGGAEPGFLAWGETVRLTALLGLGLQAFLGVLTAVVALRAYGMIGTVDPLLAQAAGPAGSPERLANILGVLTGPLWFAPFAALLLGHPRAARTLALVALAAGLPILVQTSLNGFPGLALAGLPAPLVTVTALWAGFQRDSRPARRSPWLLLPPLAAGVAVAALYEVVASPAATVAWVWPWLDELGLRSAFVLGAGVAYVCVHAYAPARRTPSWPLALAILALPTLCARLVGLSHHFGFADGISRTITLGMVGQAVLLLALVVGGVVLGMRILPAAPARSGRGPVEG